jgi:hypothetical protein
VAGVAPIPGRPSYRPTAVGTPTGSPRLTRAGGFFMPVALLGYAPAVRPVVRPPLRASPGPNPMIRGWCPIMGEDYPYAAKRQIVSLVQTLETLTKRDSEQEVQGIALPVLDAVIESVRSVLPDDPIVEAVRGILSPEQIASGEAIRAADALLVAKQLDAAIGPEPLMIGIA